MVPTFLSTPPTNFWLCTPTIFWLGMYTPTKIWLGTPTKIWLPPPPIFGYHPHQNLATKYCFISH